MQPTQLNINFNYNQIKEPIAYEKLKEYRNRLNKNKEKYLKFNYLLHRIPFENTPKILSALNDKYHINIISPNLCFSYRGGLTEEIKKFQEKIKSMNKDDCVYMVDGDFNHQDGFIITKNNDNYQLYCITNIEYYSDKVRTVVFGIIKEAINYTKKTLRVHIQLPGIQKDLETCGVFTILSLITVAKKYKIDKSNKLPTVLEDKQLEIFKSKLDNIRQFFQESKKTKNKDFYLTLINYIKQQNSIIIPDKKIMLKYCQNPLMYVFYNAMLESAGLEDGKIEFDFDDYFNGGNKFMLESVQGKCFPITN